jgi:formyltetrahydrofolate deformylase
LKDSAILLVQCPDRRGLDAALADFIYQHNGNILHFEEHQVGEKGFYLARVEWDLAGFQLDVKDFSQVCAHRVLRVTWRWRSAATSRALRFSFQIRCCAVFLPPRTARLASSAIWMPSATPICNSVSLIAVTKENKPEAERQGRNNMTHRARALHASAFDGRHHPQRIINIHHSFLLVCRRKAAPAGYVKLIGALAHFVPSSRRWPISARRARISHAARTWSKKAATWNASPCRAIENRILLYGNKTVIFRRRSSRRTEKRRLPT